MVLTAADASLSGMSDTTHVNGHKIDLPVLAATWPPPALPAAVPVAGPQPGGGSTGTAPAPTAAGPAKRKGRWFQNLITIVVALIATAAASTGMWAYFRDVLHITNPYLLVGVFAVFELSLFVSALRARRARIDDPDEGKAGVDGYAVWVLATTSGVLAALDESTWAARCGRLALPLLAAWMFERATSAERDDKRSRGSDGARRRRKRINWRISPDRIMVAVGLADATDRAVEDVDRSRTIARLSTLAYRAHMSGWLFRGRAGRRYTRSLAKANERLSLAKDQSLVGEVRAGVALLYQALDATRPEAVDTASPWARAAAREQSALDRQQRPAPAAPRRQVAADARAETHERVVVAAPTTKTTRPAEENWALIGQHLATNPSTSKAELASKLGISRTRVGQIFDQFTTKTTREDPPDDEPHSHP